MPSLRRAVPLPLLVLASLVAQDPNGPPGGFQGPGGFGGPGGPGGMRQHTKVLERCDLDKNGRLDAAERQAARAWLKDNRPQRGMRGPGGPGGPGGPDGPRGPGGFGGPPGGERIERSDTPTTAARVVPADVTSFEGKPLFDLGAVRTYFLELPGDDWFAELSDFYHTDVEVPATVTVDGKVYKDVGVQFRGNTSYMAPGRKKSFDLSFDFADKKQNLQGVRNLDLLNGNSDPTSMREAIHGFLANQFFPCARVALARVVVNGEDYGVYAAMQQFDKEFAQDHFGTKHGDRWKVPPDFSGNGGLRFLGEEPEAYRREYELKSAESPRAWQALVDVCAALAQAPDDRVEAIVPQHLDVDAALWFLAIDMALGDDDGYFTRASDYVLYRDPSGRFHPIPRDNNEILPAERGGRGPGGPGGPGFGAPGDGAPGNRPDGPRGPGFGAPGGMRGPGGPGGPGGAVASTPLQGASRADRPLLHRLLSVPAWRERYLADVRTLAMAMGDDNLGKQVAAWRTLIEPLQKIDAHSLYGYGAFTASFATDAAGKPAPHSLLGIAAQRRQAILGDASMQGAWPEAGAPKIAVGKGDANVVGVTCTAGGAKIAAVRLHASKGAFGSFATTALLDDGKHGDGASGDGVYGGELPACAPGETVRYWIEVVAAESGHVACQPAGNGAQPLIWTAPAATKKNK